MNLMCSHLQTANAEAEEKYLYIDSYYCVQIVSAVDKELSNVEVAC
jgi:hypothetical protein